jgi:hypothetical protein
MKTTIYKNLQFFLFLLYSTYCFSQSNLQFNDAITKTAAQYGGTFPTFTVPTGKIWKLERYRRDCLIVNNGGVKDSYTWIYGAQQGGGIAIDTAPIWLKEGDSFYFNGCGDWFFSLLEFNKL